MVTFLCFGCSDWAAGYYFDSFSPGLYTPECRNCDNVNIVYFDGIQLFKETFGSTYTYDTNGNLTSVVDLQNKTTTYEYTNNNLTAEVLPTGARLEYVYDNYHNVTKATTEEGLVYNFTYDTYGNNTKVAIAGSPTLSSSAAYTSDGNRLASTTDAAGKTTTYSYNANTNVLEWVQYPEDTTATRTEYTYDSMFRMSKASATTNTGLNLTASYVYDTDDTLKSITTGSTTYNFTYGNFALRSSVKAGTRTLATYTYTNDKNNYLQKLAYGNGDSVQYTYDTQGRVTKETYEDGSTVTYKYDNSGALATVTDSQSGITTTYYYDFIDRMMKYVESGNGYSHSVGYEYDTINNLTKLVETINGSKYTTTYDYDDDNRITSVTEGSISDNYTYDSYGRLDEQIVKNGNTEAITNTYSYDGTSSTTTGRINNKYIIANNFYANYTLVYDDNGNITKAIDGTIDVDYVYDTANQLVREDNFNKGFTHTWTYDKAGNILSRKEYAYTSATTLGTPTKTVTYTYETSNWGDLLIGYDGKTISYDTIGNPLTVKDASDNVLRSYTWEHGRQLVSLTENGTIWNYTYNADGLRTKRTNGSTIYQYVYNGDKLSQLTVAGHTLKFVYGSTGPVAVVYDGTVYYYVTNPQGDVTHIVDGTGEAVVYYSYDAWGNTATIYDGTTGLGTYNPLRYRGYVYDQESGLYYLQSRYYDPEVGRFLNADGLISTGQGLLSYNMFAYCGNNPVCHKDEQGARYCAATSVQAESAAERKISCQHQNAIAKEHAFNRTYAEELAVLNGKSSTYKGVKVHKIMPGTAGFSFGDIFLPKNAGTELSDIMHLRHEYGHTVQLEKLGVWNYAMLVVVPSVSFYAIDELIETNVPYYSLPWEFEADAFGNVTGRKYNSDYFYFYMWYTNLVSQITGNKMNYPTSVAL